MAKPFKRTRKGVSAKLGEGEQALLAHLFVEVWELLGSDEGVGPTDPLEAMVGIGTATEEPADPALARLLPSANREDDEAAAEFRRYTEQGLRERKRAGLETARTTLGREGQSLDLTMDEARAWLVALNDVRLVVGERLGLRTDEDADALVDELDGRLDDPDADDEGGAGEEDPRVFMAAIYDFLTWLQESLVHALAA
jgi:hypothetical protein